MDDYNGPDDGEKSYYAGIKALRLKHVAAGKDDPRNDEEELVAPKRGRKRKPRSDAYADFLAAKGHTAAPVGIEPCKPFPDAMKPFQTDLTRWALRRGRAAIFAGTGLGKTLMQISWADHVHRATDGRVLILTPLAVAQQTIAEAQKFGIEGVAYALDQAKAKSRIVVTNYDRFDKFDPGDFSAIVLDECFARDTFIDVVERDGKIGRKHIENVRPGDKILNVAGVDVVSDVHRRAVPYAIRVSYAGNEIIASPNHPFFTRRGWVGAQDLRSDDEVVATPETVRMVRNDVYSQDASERRTSAVLREILLSEMADAAAGTSSQGIYGRAPSQDRRKKQGMARQWLTKRLARVGAHSRAQSDQEPGDARQNLPPIERDEARTFRAWGQWSWADLAAAIADGCAIRQLDSGICFVTGATGSRLSYALQARLGATREQNRHRSGWSFPRGDGQEETGCQEGCQARGFRVDGVEVLKPGNPDLDQYRDADGQIYFYDLGGTRHPSFSVGGALVHNSSIIKAQDSKTRKTLIAACKDIPFKLCCTATPAPNDWVELGNHAEFLGVMTQKEMLSMYFVHDGSIRANEDAGMDGWRLKRHAADAFWRWVASWAAMVRHPRDLGYEEPGYDLPPLIRHQVTVEAEHDPESTGALFQVEAQTLSERLAARRDTVDPRVDAAAAIVNAEADKPWLVWCHLNKEAEAVTKLIPGAVEVRGTHDRDVKAERLLGFCKGNPRVLVSKAKIAGFGMNFQNCADVVFVGLSDSFEELYQAIRRCWRFAQTKPVNVYLVASSREGAVVKNLERKEAAYEAMGEAMAKHMREFVRMEVRGDTRKIKTQSFEKMELPAWLK